LIEICYIFLLPHLLWQEVFIMVKKKVLCTLVITALLLPASIFAAAPSVYANTGNGQSFSDETGVTPFFAAVASIVCSLTFSNGNANCAINVTVPQSKADSIAFQVTLYKKVGASWQSVTSWNTTAPVSSMNLASFYQSASVPSGNTYRFSFTATVYKGGTVVETINYTMPERSN
jgi:hypothetical protein